MRNSFVQTTCLTFLVESNFDFRFVGLLIMIFRRLVLQLVSSDQPTEDIGTAMQVVFEETPQVKDADK